MTRARRHLVIFAKAPSLGRVKTRLARGIGTGAALAFYRLMLARLLRQVGRDPRWRVTLAVAPDRTAQAARLWPMRLARKGQGRGDLGDRMGRTLRRWPAGSVVIIGADIPDITAAHIARAFAALDAADLVFGPARDGGYWLVGAKGAARRTPLFARVRWSTEHALADTLANLKGRRIAFIDTLDDIDDVEDLRRWRLATPSPSA
jgi:rSAM/selenodomain-associated transferase 1